MSLNEGDSSRGRGHRSPRLFNNSVDLARLLRLSECPRSTFDDCERFRQILFPTKSESRHPRSTGTGKVCYVVPQSNHCPEIFYR